AARQPDARDRAAAARRADGRTKRPARAADRRRARSHRAQDGRRRRRRREGGHEGRHAAARRRSRRGPRRARSDRAARARDARRARAAGRRQWARRQAGPPRLRGRRRRRRRAPAAAARRGTAAHARAARSRAARQPGIGRTHDDSGAARMEPVGARHRGVQAGLCRLAVARRRRRGRARARGSVGRRAAGGGAGARPAARGRQRARARRVPPAGVEILRIDRGEEAAVTFAAPLPLWAFALVALAALGVAWLAYRDVPIAPARRRALSALRLTTLLWIMLCLMRPLGRPTSGAPRDAIVPILVQTSRGMGLADAGSERRIDRARAAIERDLLPALEARFHPEVLRFGDRLAASQVSDLSATDRRTSLGAALEAVRDRYRGRPIAGIVLVSDGGDNGTADAVSAAAAGPPGVAVGGGSRAPGRARAGRGAGAGRS